MNYEQKYLKYKQKYIQALTNQTGGDPELVIIDTDPGIDDALAILLALGNRKLKVIALTTVFGNFPDVRKLTDNALKILNLANKRDIPVYEGVSKPLCEMNLTSYIRKTMAAQSVEVHGTDGLGNLEPKRFTTGGLKKQEEHAVQAIIRLATENPGQITLITLGPLTNLATALDKEPNLPNLLKKVIIMGGALFSPRGNPINTSDANIGNARPSAEANFFKDPDAAQIVLRAGFDPCSLFLIPLDITTKTNYRNFGLSFEPPKIPENLDDGIITEFIARTHHYYSGIYIDRFKRDKVPFHDACAVFLAISPDSFKGDVQISINVETKGELTSGMTVINNSAHLPPPIRAPNNVTYYQHIEENELFAAIKESINTLQRELSTKP
jgi:inosine-uridine nucleoside N-ribohydrolase